MWRPLLAAGVLTVAVAGVAALSSAHLYGQTSVVDAQTGAVRDARERGERSVDGRSLLAPEPSDFVRRLPGSIELQPILSALQRSASEADIVFVGVLVREHPGTKELLSRVDLSVSLRGPYPKVTQVLAEALSRYPNATLSRASLRRAAQSDQVEATMIIALWGAADAMPRAANETTSQADPGLAPMSAGR